MRAIFPQKWDQQYPSEQIAALNMIEWASGIAGLTDEQLARGVNETRIQCAWPPSISEFRAMCVEHNDWEHKGDAYKPFQKALPAPLCKKEIAQAERDKLRKLGIKL
jgi:hypothetical protein